VTTQPREKPKLASIPKEVTITGVSLWKESMENSSEMKINKMLAKCGFFDSSRNPRGSFVNDLIDNNDGTVTDKATGLMWQKIGSSTRLDNQRANIYIERSNQERFAGHSGWRMPTVEELASLLKKSKKSGVHIDPVFGNKQTRCWTIDNCDSLYVELIGAWIVDFKQGIILQAEYKKPGVWVAPGPDYSKNTTNHIKAVRSVKSQ
jgi:hypothetical protein